jgi:hypothetical protein
MARSTGLGRKAGSSQPAQQELNPQADKREVAAAPFLGCQLKIEPLPSGL